jgi:hypothetical protein
MGSNVPISGTEHRNKQKKKKEKSIGKKKLTILSERKWSNYMKK